MRESAVWRWFLANKPEWLAIERVEVLFPPGMADCFWTDTRTGISGWLELKHCEAHDPMYKAGRIPKLRPAQPLFLTRQAKNNVPAGILLRAGEDNWHVWRASGTHGWSKTVQGRDALASTDGNWRGVKPTVAEIMAVFIPTPIL